MTPKLGVSAHLEASGAVRAVVRGEEASAARHTLLLVAIHLDRTGGCENPAGEQLRVEHMLQQMWSTRATLTPCLPCTQILPCQRAAHDLDRITVCSSTHLRPPRLTASLRAVAGRTHTAADMTLHLLVACGAGCLRRSRASPIRRAAGRCELSPSHTGARRR